MAEWGDCHVEDDDREGWVLAIDVQMGKDDMKVVERDQDCDEEVII
jgi:hypothetical protein